MRLLPAIFLIFTLPAAHAEIYKWVDSDGNVHYGDQPDTAAARPMKKLPALSTYAPPVVPEKEESAPGAPEIASPADKAGPNAAAKGYRSISIVSPEDQATVRSSPGTVPVFVALAPVLRKGDYLKVILDGKALPGKYQGTVINLENVDRGEHKLAVAVYDKQGRKQLQSDARTFYLHRTIAKPRPSPR